MITSTKLTNKLVGFSAKIKGISYINKGFQSNDVGDEIKPVIMANFNDVLKLNIGCDFEEYEDLRTLKKCAILNIEMLIVFRKKPKAERGMLLTGARHSGGGIDINAEDGEVIINRNSSAKYLPLLSAINEDGGGVPFMAKGGIAGSIRPSTGTLIDYDKLAISIGALPPPRVAIDEIASIQNQVSVIESQSIF
jgi:hypothetical protein